MTSHLNKKLHERTSGKGVGTFCTTPVQKGEVLAVFGGNAVTREELSTYPLADRQNCVQVTGELYLVPFPAGPGDHFNHSCVPNAGISGQIVLVAMRDIAVGEEVCFDYAMTDSSDYDEFECWCGTTRCRQKITGTDWKLPELQARYRGYFARHIEELRASVAESAYAADLKSAGPQGS